MRTWRNLFIIEDGRPDSGQKSFRSRAGEKKKRYHQRGSDKEGDVTHQPDHKSAAIFKRSEKRTSRSHAKRHPERGKKERKGGGGRKLSDIST